MLSYDSLWKIFTHASYILVQNAWGVCILLEGKHHSALSFAKTFWAKAPERWRFRDRQYKTASPRL